MSENKGLETTFDTVVSIYDKMRPGYAPELFQKIFEYVSVGEKSRVVEVGSGSGQATLPVLKTGCELIEVNTHQGTIVFQNYNRSFYNELLKYV